jgi:hypothetical protein
MALTAINLAKKNTVTPAPTPSIVQPNQGFTPVQQALAATNPAANVTDPTANNAAPGDLPPWIASAQQPAGVPNSYWQQYVQQQQSNWQKLDDNAKQWLTDQASKGYPALKDPQGYLQSQMKGPLGLTGIPGMANPGIAKIQTYLNDFKDIPTDPSQVQQYVTQQYAALPAAQKQGYQNTDAQRSIVQQGLDLQKQTQAGNVAEFNQAVTPALQKLGAADANATAANATASANQVNQADATNQALGNINQQYAQNTAESNLASNRDAGTYASGIGQVNAAELNANNQYQQATNPLMTQLQAHGYGADVTSNATDLANQQAGIGAIQNDVNNGAAQQQSVINQYQAQTNPAVTAVERANAEAARQKFESADLASRQATMRDLAMRGLRSGGAQIAQQQATHDQLANDRLQAELGLQATAQQRAQAAMAGLSSATNAQRASNQAGAQNLASAATDARQQGDALAEFNKAQQLQTQTQQDQFAQSEANRVGGLAASRLNATTGNYQNVASNMGNVNTAQQSSINSNSDRTTSGLAAQAQNNQTQYSNNTTANQAITGAAAANVQNAQNAATTGINATTARANATNPSGVQQAMQNIGAELDTEDAKNKLS